MSCTKYILVILCAVRTASDTGVVDISPTQERLPACLCNTRQGPSSRMG